MTDAVSEPEYVSVSLPSCIAFVEHWPSEDDVDVDVDAEEEWFG